jgi:hypothetical protein
MRTCTRGWDLGTGLARARSILGLNRRRLCLISLVAMLALAAAACGGATQGERAQPSRGENGTHTQQQSVSCDFAPVRPTYLPWVDSGDPIPDPSASRSDDPESDLAGLYWTKDRGERPYYVQLIRLTFDGGSLEGTSVPVTISGVEGKLRTETEGQYPGFAEIQWLLPQSRCNDIRLWLRTSGRMTDPEAADEAVKIAESFELVDSST